MRKWTDKRYSYVTTECFRVRYPIAAYHLRACDHIIEVGGAKTRVDNFVDIKTATVVDPHIAENTFDKGNMRVRHVRNFYQKHDFSDILSMSGTKGLLLLGFAPKDTYDVMGKNDDLEALKPLMEHMNMVIIETMVRKSPGYKSFWGAERLAVEAGLKLSTQFTMNMVYDSEYDDSDSPEDLFHRQRIYKVLRR